MHHLKPPVVWISFLERGLTSLISPLFQIRELRYKEKKVLTYDHKRLMVKLRLSLLLPWLGYFPYYLLEEISHYPLLLL